MGRAVSNARVVAEALGLEGRRARSLDALCCVPKTGRRAFRPACVHRPSRVHLLCGLDGHWTCARFRALSALSRAARLAR